MEWILENITVKELIEKLQNELDPNDVLWVEIQTKY